jgi:RNA polymerase sigma-70 factor, ECF subfamily
LPCRRWRLLPLRANGSAGFAWFQKHADRDGYQAYAIQVVTVHGEQISAITTFIQPALFRFFKLPDELPA